MNGIANHGAVISIGISIFFLKGQKGNQIKIDLKTKIESKFNFMDYTKCVYIGAELSFESLIFNKKHYYKIVDNNIKLCGKIH